MRLAKGLGKEGAELRALCTGDLPDWLDFCEGGRGGGRVGGSDDVDVLGLLGREGDDMFEFLLGGVVLGTRGFGSAGLVADGTGGFCTCRAGWDGGVLLVGMEGGGSAGGLRVPTGGFRAPDPLPGPLSSPPDFSANFFLSSLILVILLLEGLLQFKKKKYLHYSRDKSLLVPFKALRRTIHG